MLAIESGPASVDTRDWVRETRFGRWFVSTDVWVKYVLRVAIADFHALVRDRLPARPVVLDAGCGIGLSFALLDDWCQPGTLIGTDIDHAALQAIAARPPPLRCELRLLHADALKLPLPDASVDLVYSHQLLHHVRAQAGVLAELRRVLRPGGILLSAESCRSFIHSWWVWLFFRHPGGVQKTAQEWVELIRAAGFELADADIRQTVPWWSRMDLGLLERSGLWSRRPPITEVNSVAFKPRQA